ncbi:MAG: NAD-dependent epimerase/dehydratase family protein [Solirubrobacteraceae bacterium]
MRIFVAGATGAIGTPLVRRLVANGHDVIGMTRSPARAGTLRAAGATAVIADALDRDAVVAAVAEARPDVVVHQLTALGDLKFPRNLDRAFAGTNRLRTEGTENLLAAALAAGARRIVAQSFAGWPAVRSGGPVKTEADPFDPDPVPSMRASLDAIKRCEELVTGTEGIEGIALRYGGFYGPGTGLSADGEQLELVRKRRFPVVGDGAGVWSFIHIDDAAAATVAAIEGGAPGVYNVTDDEPAPVRVWLPALASAAGAPTPRHVPRWVGRLAAGEAAVAMMTTIRGAANGKAKRGLGWAPAHATWREGFASLF